MLYCKIDKTDLDEITKRLDSIIGLLRGNIQTTSMTRRIFDGVATGIGILGIISIIDIIKSWFGG
jgi:hypothetical protein